MKKTLFLCYGIFSYLVFTSTVVYAMCFFGNFTTTAALDSKPVTTLTAAILIDAFLFLLLMIVSGYLNRMRAAKSYPSFVPATLCQSTFVLASSITAISCMWLWQPLGGMVWLVNNKVAIDILRIIYLAGWGMGFVSTLLVNHRELFGLRQVWLYYIGKPYTSVSFGLPDVSQLAKHPLYLGVLVTAWTTPVMTAAHLLLAIGATLYVAGHLFLDGQAVMHLILKSKGEYKPWVHQLFPFNWRRTGK